MNGGHTQIRYIYAHKTNSFLRCLTYFVLKGTECHLRKELIKWILIEICALYRANTKWWFGLTANFVYFSQQISNGMFRRMICEQLLRRWQVTVLVSNRKREMYKSYFCLFKAVSVHSKGSAEVETNAAKMLKDILCDFGHDAIMFKVSMHLFVFVGKAIKQNILIYDIDIAQDFCWWTCEHKCFDVREQQ